VSAPTLVVSDLHLDASAPEVIDQFIEFLRTEGRNASALFILGDLFEVWIGDDDPDPAKARVQAAIRELTSAGVPCFVMHGNRDFLIGRRFAAATGCVLIDDRGTVVEIAGQRALLLHGDVLCTDDHDYQRLRRRVRNPLTKAILRLLPLGTRRNLAAKMRAGSKAHIAKSMEQIMDVNPAAVEQAFRTHGVDLMIHGHTHRPAVHRLTVDGRPATRIVLGDWYDQGSVLRFDATGYELRELAR